MILLCQIILLILMFQRNLFVLYVLEHLLARLYLVLPRIQQLLDVH